MALRRRWNLSLWLAAYLVGALTIWGQESPRPLPEVTAHAPIKYVPLALQARIQGQVRLRIATDGHAVTGVTVKDGHPLLAQAAVENVRTWKFVDHVPGTFDVIKFHYMEDDATFLQQPGIVEVITTPERSIDRYTLPEQWNVQIRDAQGTIDTPLTLWTYHENETKLDGYTGGPQSQQRAIRNSHITGDMLGFDATVEDKYGQRLKFSMIGKMAGHKIKGVFLNYWGVGGAWTAERAKGASEPNVFLNFGGIWTVDNRFVLPPFVQTSITASDVIYHDHVFYPWFAGQAGIQGAVQLRVSTDYSDYVRKVEVESGNPFLLGPALANLRTWRFAKNLQRTFDVTYEYKIMDGNTKVDFLKDPGVVDIAGSLPTIDHGGCGDIVGTRPLSQFWQAELRGPGGETSATLLLNTYYFLATACAQPLDGYVVTGPGGKKPELRENHQDGDMVGFDMTVNGRDGKPLRVSVLAKKTRNKMAGVFLDYSGTPGTWTALPQGPQAKPIR